jgi:hypothetical protein
MSLDRFLLDVEALRSRTLTGPRTRMRLRWKREWGSPVGRRDLSTSTVTVWLYPSDATARTRAAWRCQVDSLVDVERVEDRSRCVVVGHLAPGRAVAIHAAGLEMVTTYPLSSPMFGQRFGS